MPQKSNILLVLDLDETLVYATQTLIDGLKADFTFDNYFVYKRPYLEHFLSEAAKHFPLAIWSSAGDDYVNQIIDTIKPIQIEFKLVWGRTKCSVKKNINFDTYYFEKRLDKLKKKGYSLEQILIVDDTAEKASSNYGNAIYIKEYLGDQFDDETLDRKSAISISACRGSPACSTSRWTGRRNGRARSPASSPNSTTGGARAIAENFEVIRESTEEQSKLTTEALRSIYDRATGDSHTMFTEAAQRFTDVVDGLKRMTAEMQRELESTRAELRKGILELPQETSESAAQMRRVIVDQIEALAELNRIVARHGRGLDTADPAVRRRRAGGGRGRAAAPGRARGAGGRQRQRPSRAAAARPRRHHRDEPAGRRAAAPRRGASARAQPRPGPRRPRPHRLALGPAHPRLARGGRSPREGCPRSPAATTGRRATRSNRWIRSPSTSPA